MDVVFRYGLSGEKLRRRKWQPRLPLARKHFDRVPNGDLMKNLFFSGI